jgi:hypothetical protein
MNKLSEFKEGQEIPVSALNVYGGWTHVIQDTTADFTASYKLTTKSCYTIYLKRNLKLCYENYVHINDLDKVLIEVKSCIDENKELNVVPIINQRSDGTLNCWLGGKSN